MRFSTTWGMPANPPKGPDDLGLLSEDVGLPTRFTARFDYEGAAHNVELDVAVHDGYPVCEAIRVERGPGQPPLSGSELRRLPVQRLVEYACTQRAFMVDTQPEANFRLRHPTDDESERVASAVRKRRRRKLTDDFLRDVMATWAEGDEAAPGEGAQHVAETFDVSDSQVYRWRQEARRREITGGEQ